MDVPPLVYPTVPSVDGHSGLFLFIVRNAAMDLPVKGRVDTFPFLRYRHVGVEQTTQGFTVELFTMATTPFQSHNLFHVLANTCCCPPFSFSPSW